MENSRGVVTKETEKGWWKKMDIETKCPETLKDVKRQIFTKIEMHIEYIKKSQE